MGESFPSVSVVIPSLHGDEENLHRLKETVLNSGIPKEKLEIIASIGVSPNGRARDVAVPETSGDYLICFDADVSFPNPGDLKTIVDFLDKNSDVGLVGPAQQIPPDLPKNVRQRAKQLPRTHVESPDQFKETDMVTHACLAISRELFLEVGMEHPNLISGTDPDLRARVRRKNLKVGLVPNTIVYHPPATTWSELIGNNFKGGRRSRAVNREFPEYHLKADPDISEAGEELHSSIVSKIIRHLTAIGRKLISGHVWALTAQMFYVSGYAWEIIAPRQWVDPIPYPSDPGPDHPEWVKFTKVLKTEGKTRFLSKFGRDSN